jgi:hypothetical protein
MHHRPLVLASLLVLSTTVAARAQCTVSWSTSPFGGGANGSVCAVVAEDGRTFTVAGRFTSVSGVGANRIARWNGSAWQPLGSGLDGDALAAVRMPNGDLVVGGSFTQAGGLAANSIARWNGTTWSPLGNGIDQPLPFGGNVQALAVMPNGDLIAAGGFPGASGVAASNIARWNGAGWSPLGAGCNSPVRCLAVAPNGDLFATGSFTQAGGVACAGIARWNGTAWSALGSGLGLFGGQALAALPNGDIVVGGSFVTAGGGAANRIARWNGSVWTQLGTGLSGPVTALAAHPNGEIVAGGSFTTAGGQPAANLARWNGATWQAFGAGCNANVLAVSVLGDGAVAVGGDFTQAGGAAAGRFAQLVSTCAPTLTATGNGCAGAGGTPALTVERLPLLGGSYRTRCTNLPTNTIVLSVLGLSATVLPLAAALPQAGAGCTVVAAPDSVDALLPVGGVATAAVTMPSSATLLGTTLHQQFVPLEFDALFNLVGGAASNAVRTTLGSF